MEKTYTQSCDFEIVIKGTYSCGNMYEEALEDYPINEDNIWEFVGDNFPDFYQNAEIKITNRKTIEE